MICDVSYPIFIRSSYMLSQRTTHNKPTAFKRARFRDPREMNRASSEKPQGTASPLVVVCVLNRIIEIYSQGDSKKLY